MFGLWLLAAVIVTMTVPDALSQELRTGLMAIGALAIGGAGSGFATASARVGRVPDLARPWCLAAAGIMVVFSVAALFSIAEAQAAVVGVALVGAIAIASIYAGLTLLSIALDSHLPRVAKAAGVTIALAGGMFALSGTILGFGLVESSPPLRDLVLMLSRAAATTLGLSWTAAGLVLIGSAGRRGL